MPKVNTLISGGYWSGGSIYPNLSNQAAGSENTKPEPEEQSKMTTEDMPTVNRSVLKMNLLTWFGVAIALIFLMSWVEK